MIPSGIIKKISEIVGPSHIVTKEKELVEYGSDATKQAYPPDAVVFPGSAEEISKIFLLANREGFPVVPRGGGSGMSGGALPVMGGVVISMSRFDRILSIDEDNLVAKVEPEL